MTVTKRRFSTGLRFLDSRIDGGIQTGGLLALTAPPDSQSELLLRQFVQAHPAHYASTVRPAAEIEEWLTRGGPPTSEFTVSYWMGDELLKNLEEVAADLAPESFLIIDSTNVLETASRNDYLAFLNDVKELLTATDSVGVLHCFDHAQNPPHRNVTLARADQVWQLQLRVLSRDITTQLLITKARNGRALSKPIDLKLTDRVQIDTSRTI